MKCSERDGDRPVRGAPQHEMTVETEQYEKQYGYAYMSRVTCSCGYDSGMTPGDYVDSIRVHREQAILDALGLTFSVTK